jgi:TolB protein
MLVLGLEIAALIVSAPLQQRADTARSQAWPQWSPDGRHIVFASTRDDGDWEIYRMGANGENPRRLTRSAGRDAHPMFMPGGLRIVFQSPRGHASSDQVDLYLMDASGERLRRIVAAPGFNGVPVPSPDRAWIAFQRSPIPPPGGAYHWELFLVDSLGRRERQLTANAWSSQVPTWSPDSRRLAWFANPQGRDQLFIMDLKSPGGALVPIAASLGTDMTPAWSPDGRTLAFVSTRDGPRDLYRVEIADGRVLRLTSGLDVWSQPSWSPDGQRLLFSAKTGDVDRIYVVNADGTGLRPLDPHLPVVLVALSERDSLVGLDGETLQRLFALPTGKAPHEVVISGDGRRAFVANTGAASVASIDLSTRARGPTYALGDGNEPHDVAMDADGRTLWITVARQRALLELDAETGQIRRRWALPADGGWMVDAGPRGTPVIVAHLEGAGVSLIDRTAGRVEFLPLVAGEIEAVLSPDGATIWSTNMNGDSVTVSAVATRARRTSFPSGGRRPVRVLLTPDGRTAVVANGAESALQLIDTGNPARRSEIALPQAPKVLALSPDGAWLYVSHPDPGGVSLIDLAACKVVRTVALSGTPDGIAVSSPVPYGSLFTTRSPRRC